MRIYRHITANDVQLEAFPFRRELSMEAYLIDNEQVLALDEDVFTNVEVIAAEVPLERVRKNKDGDGRIDILATYSDEYVAIVELKLGEVDQAALDQLEEYLSERAQLVSKYKNTFGTDSSPNPKWIGVLVGSSIAPDFAKRFRDGYQTGVDRIPVAALTVQRFRGSDGSVLVTTDSHFKLPGGRDTSKYLFEGKTLGKGRLVLAVVKRYVASHPETTFAQLEKAFPKSLQGGLGVVATLDQANDVYARDERRRHFLNRDDLMELQDGPAAVCSQWGIGNIDAFRKRAAELGFAIQPVTS